jgi:hypothetical protein
MQRARERSYNEKLKARYEGRAHKRNCEPDTLLPALEASSRIIFFTDPESVFAKCQNVWIRISRPRMPHSSNIFYELSLLRTEVKLGG